MLETGQTNSLHPCTLNSNTEESKEGRRIKAQMRLVYAELSPRKEDWTRAA